MRGNFGPTTPLAGSFGTGIAPSRLDTRRPAWPRSAPVIGRTLAHYRIDQRLGAGGMGAVYLARDLALGRPVAIKVVGSDLDPSLRERLLREAAACARLQHPAIATFYESGETPEGAFIAMEYVRGATLRDRLAAGPLPLRDALAIAAALLEALNHAHAAGIVHRDIKPENIMLPREGPPKLLDFGLARFGADAQAGAATATNLTAGRLLGTFGYMAPEQITTDDVDGRADLFAVGAVVYEMISGRAAFPGAHPGERMAAILSREPPPLGGHGVPAGLDALLARALAKDPASRYPSASAMLSDLRGLMAGEQAVSLPQTLAVLDLRNLSGRPEDDWVGSGIAESLTTDLARIPGLSVIARDRLLRISRELAAGGDLDALEIGRCLGCRWILSGSFQRLGPAVRITTMLAEVGTGQIAAAEKLDGSMEGIFELQDRLSRTVAESLNLRVPTPRPAVARDLQAFEYYARGRRLWLRLEKGTFEQAGELYRKAIEIEPSHPQALAGLAGLHAMRFTFTTDARELEIASDYAGRSIAANQKLADPHVWLGYALMRQERSDEALAALQRAAELEPDLAFPPYFAGCIEMFRGRPADALPWLQKAVTLDPKHGFAWLSLGSSHTSLGHFDQGRWCFERAMALEGTPGAATTVGARGHLAECLRLAGDLAGAREACLAALEMIERSDHMYRDSVRGTALCVLGRTALDQGDPVAAAAAFRQLVAHVTGRERTLGGGYLVVQALAGLARATGDPQHLDQAQRLFAARDRFNFSKLWTCTDDAALLELGRAAMSLGRDEGLTCLQRARDAGSLEAQLLLQGVRR